MATVIQELLQEITEEYGEQDAEEVEQAFTSLNTAWPLVLNELQQLNEKVNFLETGTILSNAYSRLSGLMSLNNQNTSLSAIMQGTHQRMLEANLWSEYSQIAVKIGSFYFTTMELLEKARIISPVKYTIIYKGKNGASNIITDYKLSAQNLYLDKHSGVLRFKGLKQDVDVLGRSIKDVGKNRANLLKKWVVNHYNSFTSLYTAWFNQPAQRTGYRKHKFNSGYASESFMRHWEEADDPSYIIDATIEPNWNNDDHFRSVGHRWQLYKQSMGREPFYTGADTKEYQVKQQNSSLTSLNNIILTVQALITLLNSNIPADSVRQSWKNAMAEILKQAPLAEDGLDNMIEKDVEAFLDDTFTTLDK